MHFWSKIREDGERAYGRSVSFVRKNKVAVYVALAIVLCALVFGYSFLWRAPKNFPFQAMYTVKEGATVSSVAHDLVGLNIIRSPLFFKNIAIALGGERGILAGDYFFAKPISVWGVAKRLAKGDLGLAPLKITVREGNTIFEIANIFSKNLEKFDSAEFLEHAKEGYLFPDTYFFLPNASASDTLMVLGKNFSAQAEKLDEKIASSSRAWSDVVVMASILEEEARTTETRKIISGILWKRIDIGMPLQVDAAFQYVNGKNSYELTTQDLEIDSPYNTYKYAGLPPTPISNPGLDSLLAALEPEETDYLYFLSSRDGTMHYAKDFEGHKENRRLYLDI